MNRDNTLWEPIQSAELEWPEDSGPRSKHYDDVYFSPAGGLAESEHVFLRGNGLPERWKRHDRPLFCIIETGFGTALNFLVTWDLWRRQSADRPILHYISVEKYPLNKADLSRALSYWPSLANLAAQLEERYPEPIRGQHRLILEEGKVILDLWWENVEDALVSLSSGEHKPADAWYLDGFCPARNESMWTQRLYSAMAAASRPSATFSTFSAAGDVRRGLSTAGFTVTKATGFGPKRECLQGVVEQPLPHLDITHTPWDLKTQPGQIPNSVIILGAGLAGCTTANALAQRNIDVTLIEAGQVASAGSGNNQGILYTRLSSRHSSLTDFALQSFCFSHHFYKNLLSTSQLLEDEDGSLCGSFHQKEATDEMLALREALKLAPELAEVLDRTAAAVRTGLDQPSGGYWFPKSGWMRPASVCKALLNHPKITLIERTGPADLQQCSEGWRASIGKNVLATADCAVIATGISAQAHPELSWLPGQFIRGQTTELPTNNVFGALSTGLCHTGYFAPARRGSHCIG
ncbi:MAG: tRNA 5-methylaminomethyl-2-thiouridine biosynthesis bifunctional protein, partial [Halioglobus sp.]